MRRGLDAAPPCWSAQHEKAFQAYRKTVKNKINPFVDSRQTARVVMLRFLQRDHAIVLAYDEDFAKKNMRFASKAEKRRVNRERGESTAEVFEGTEEITAHGREAVEEIIDKHVAKAAQYCEHREAYFRKRAVETYKGICKYDKQNAKRASAARRRDIFRQEVEITKEVLRGIPHINDLNGRRRRRFGLKGRFSYDVDAEAEFKRVWEAAMSQDRQFALSRTMSFSRAYSQETIVHGGGRRISKAQKHADAKSRVGAAIFFQKIFRGFVCRLYVWALHYFMDPTNVRAAFQRLKLLKRHRGVLHLPEEALNDPKFEVVEDDVLDRSCVPNVLNLMGVSLQEWSVAKEREYLLTKITKEISVIYYPTFCDWWKRNIPFHEANVGMLRTYKLALHHYQKDVHETKGAIIQDAADLFQASKLEKRHSAATISKKKVEDACFPASPTRTFKKFFGRGLGARGKSITLPDLKEQTLQYVDLKLKFETKFEIRRRKLARSHLHALDIAEAHGIFLKDCTIRDNYLDENANSHITSNTDGRPLRIAMPPSFEDTTDKRFIESPNISPSQRIYSSHQSNEEIPTSPSKFHRLGNDTKRKATPKRIGKKNGSEEVKYVPVESGGKRASKFDKGMKGSMSQGSLPASSRKRMGSNVLHGHPSKADRQKLILELFNEDVQPLFAESSFAEKGKTFPPASSPKFLPEKTTYSQNLIKSNRYRSPYSAETPEQQIRSKPKFKAKQQLSTNSTEKMDSQYSSAEQVMQLANELQLLYP